MQTQMLIRIMRTAWSVFFLLAASFVMLHSPPLLADEGTEHQMRELFKTAGPPPEAIINPPQPVIYKLSIQERLGRVFRENFLGFRITHASARGRACHGNQRVLAGAVEMYNMENATSTMKSLRHADVISPTGALIIGCYLKGPITPPDKGCEYYSYGDLTDSGIIYCTLHGTNEDYRAALVKVTGLKPDSAFLDDEFVFAVTIIAIFLLLSILVLLALFYKMRKPAEGQPE